DAEVAAQERPTGSNTTHFCVLDGEGGAVSNTYSLNTMFGRKLAVEGGGFLLNNSLDDFAFGTDQPNWYDLVEDLRNPLVAGRRRASSMAPTIVQSAGGAVELVIGGSGGPRIPTLIVQTLLGVFADHLPLGDAVRAPRIHHQLGPDAVAVERT